MTTKVILCYPLTKESNFKAQLVVEYINEQFNMLRNNIATIEEREPYSGAGYDNYCICIPEYLSQYRNTIEEICRSSCDFWEGYKLAVKHTMEKVQPHLKVTYNKAYPKAA